MKKIASIFAVAICTMMMAFGIVGCGSNGSSVAATFNGGQITEDEVSSYIAQVRAAYGYETDEDWANYLASIGMQPEQVRSDIITMLAQEKILAQAVKDAGLTIDESVIDTAIESVKSQYSSEEEFQKSLEAQGTSEQQLRDTYRQSLIETQVREQLAKAPEATPEMLATYIAQEAPKYDGAKRSSHILFELDNRDEAQSVLERARWSGEETFAELAKEYSTDGSAKKGGDVGWDKLSTFVSEYQTALDSLEVGQVTPELVESQFGYHIIRCTDEFTYTEGMSPEDIPEEILAQITSTMNSDLEKSSYTEYVRQLVEDANLVINDMPAGLPYDVEVSIPSAPASEPASSATAQDSGTAAGTKDR